MKFTEEQFQKLPKWAKTEIMTLKAGKESVEKRVAEFEGKEETNTFLSHGLSQSPLPNNSQIKFKTGKNNSNSVSVYVRNDGTVDVNTDSIMGQTMVIMPRATNSFYITFI